MITQDPDPWRAGSGRNCPTCKEHFSLKMRRTFLALLNFFFFFTTYDIFHLLAFSVVPNTNEASHQICHLFSFSLLCFSFNCWGFKPQKVICGTFKTKQKMTCTHYNKFHTITTSNTYITFSFFPLFLFQVQQELLVCWTTTLSISSSISLWLLSLEVNILWKFPRKR